MTDLSIVIVSFNTADKLRKCLRSVFASQTKYQFDVWVVDNASTDGSAQMVERDFPQVHLIKNQKNLGYSKANNLALRQATGELILLLNSDVELLPETLEKMIGYMKENASVGISSCRVEKPDGSLDLASRRSFPSPANSLFRLTGLSFLFPKSRLASYNLTYLPEDKIAVVDSVMGAFLLTRSDVVKKIGLLDEDFFMYGEDLDWCYRAKENGYQVVFAPITKVIHHKGSSSRRAPKRALYEFHRAMALFYDKHYRQNYGFLINWIVKLGIWTRYVLKSLQNSFRQEKYVSK